MKRLYCLIFIFIFAYSGLWAQPFNMNPDIEPYEIKLTPYTPPSGVTELAKGKLGYLKITQDKEDTAYFFVNGISIYSPVFVNVTPVNSEDKIKVQLHKINWERILRSGTASGKEGWSENFKTEGDFGIMVIPESIPAEYHILTWVGDEPKMELPSIFTNQIEEADKEIAGSPAESAGKPWMYLLIGFLLAIILFLGFKVMKKPKN